jgi:hypothetical protein
VESGMSQIFNSSIKTTKYINNSWFIPLNQHKKTGVFTHTNPSIILMFGKAVIPNFTAHQNLIIMKTLFAIIIFFVGLLSLTAQENILACYTISYEDNAEFVIDEKSTEPMVYFYENDPVSKIVFHPDNNILEVIMREVINRNLLLTDKYGATLAAITLDESRDTYKFSLAAYDSDILYLITSGETGLYQYTIDRTGK